MAQDTPDVDVRRNDAEHRYEAHIEGAVAGVAAYRVDGDDVVFTHTEVQPRWEGTGVAGRLAAGALDDVVGAGKRVVPECEYIAKYIDEHPSYAHHVDRR